jgi:hypothetical protein
MIVISVKNHAFGAFYSSSFNHKQYVRIAVANAIATLHDATSNTLLYDIRRQGHLWQNSIQQVRTTR